MELFHQNWTIVGMFWRCQKQTLIEYIMLTLIKLK